jgi:hypothetical protein
MELKGLIEKLPGQIYTIKSWQNNKIIKDLLVLFF